MNCWWTIIGKKNWPFIWNNPFVRLLDKWEKVSLTLIDTYTFLSRPLSPLSYSLSFSQSLSTYFFPSLSLSHCISLPLSVYLSYYFSLSYSLPLSVPLFSLSIYLNFSPSPLTTSSSILLTKVSKIKGMQAKARQKPNDILISLFAVSSAKAITAVNFINVTRAHFSYKFFNKVKK